MKALVLGAFVASYTGDLLLLPLAVLARLQQKMQRTVRRMVRRTRLPTLTLRRMISSCRGIEASVSSMLTGPAAAGYLPLHAAGDLPGPSCAAAAGQLASCAAVCEPAASLLSSS